MTITDATQDALAADPGRYIRLDLGNPGYTLKGPYYSVRDADGREVMQTTEAVTTQLAHSGKIRARPYGGEGFHQFDQL
jgi:hypothetical protein